MDQQGTTPNITPGLDHPRGGIELRFDLESTSSTQLSPTWHIAGWDIQFVCLAPGATLSIPPGRHYAKVILGQLARPARGCFAEDFSVRSTRISETELQAADDSVLLALLTAQDDEASRLHDMSDCHFSGPASEKLEWRSFKDRFGQFTDYFDELDNHMADGFHLADKQGRAITYVNFWTCRSEGDVSTHNHAQDPSPGAPAFAEVHLVLKHAAESSGMYGTDGPEGLERRLYPMQPGDEHGPFFEHQDGMPTLRPNGAVSYPWHGWQSGIDDNGVAAYDLVAAFEIYPEYARLESLS